MKALTLSVMILFSLCVPLCLCAQQQSPNLVKNGDFEKFTGDNPDNWETSNIPGTLTVVSATKTCFSGQHAVKCEVKDFFGSCIAGYVCQKNIPIGGRDVRLTCHYLLHSVGEDQGVIVLAFLNENGSTIGSDEEYLDETNSKFLAFAKEIKAPSGAASLNVRVTILAAKSTDKIHQGSHIICDDLKLIAIAPKEKQLLQ